MNEISMQSYLLRDTPSTDPQIADFRSRIRTSLDTCAATLRSSGRFLYARIPSVEDMRKLLLNVAIVAGVVFAAAIIGKASFRSYVTIDTIAVPKSISDRGLSGDIIAQRLLDEITEVGRVSRVKHSLGEFSTFSFDRTLPKIDLPVGGISIGMVVAALRDFFGLIDTKIAGEIVVDDAAVEGKKGYWLRLRINDRGTVYRQSEPTDNLDAVIREAAIRVVERFDPHIAAAYYFARNDTASALRMIHVALGDSAAGNDAEALNLRGMVTKQQNRLDDALTQFRDLRARFPRFLEAQHNIAATLILMGRYEEALTEAKKGIKLDPYNVAGYSNAGSALYSVGAYDEALVYFEKSTSIDPSAAVGYINQAAVYKDRANPDYDTAIARYRRAADVDARDQRIFFGWADLLQKLNKRTEARALLTRAIDAAPSSPIGYDQLGNAWGEEREWAKAAEQYREAVKQAPSELPYRYHLASALREGGNLDEAEKALLQIIDIDPGSALAYASLAATRAAMLRTLRHNMAAESGFERTRAYDLANAFEARITDLLDRAKQLAPRDAEVLREIANAQELLGKRNMAQALGHPGPADQDRGAIQ